MKRPNGIWAIVLLGAMLWSGWSAYAGGGFSDGESDAKTLLRIADRLYGSIAYVAVQHSGDYAAFDGDESFAKLAERVSSALRLPAAEPVRDANGHWVFVAEGSPAWAESGRLQAALAGWADGTTHLTVRWDAPAGMTSNRIAAWMDEAAAKLKPLGVRPDWMTTVRGNVGYLSQDGIDALWANIRDALDGTPVETYTDAGSEIVSFSSPLFNQGLRIRDAKVNVQAALHRSSEDGTFGLTIATPLIASES
jgi:hypothetical protein